MTTTKNKAKVYSKHTLWIEQAPNFNFELDEDELLHVAIERNFVSAVGDNQYVINEEYNNAK